jgi:glyoxylase-like metal-dependent hydrolase (beta-lactamase superfamily II)
VLNPPIRIGNATVRRVEEMRASMPLAMFNLSEAQIESQTHWLFPHWADRATMTWDMVVQSWLLEVDGRIVVIDPCVGNGRHLPHFALFDNLDTPFLERFEATGVRPHEVDAVFCTHLHSDHCGWNTHLRDGRMVPTFPNARYYLSQSEVDRWDPRRPGHNDVPENAGIFAASVLPIIEAGLAELIPDDFQISPSLTVEPAHGHTLGHTALHLFSAGAHGWFTGDVFHHPIELLLPEIDAGTCEDYPGTVATRRRIIDRLVETGGMILPAHFVEPHCGWMRETGGVRRFEPYTA